MTKVNNQKEKNKKLEEDQQEELRDKLMLAKDNLEYFRDMQKFNLIKK